jgi:vacuolar-type H+-ATPase subunit I/STV1
LEKKGIVIDPKASNFFYDKQKGFSVLDFHLADGSEFCAPEQQVMSLKSALKTRKYPKIDWRGPNVQMESDKQVISERKIEFKLLIQFLNILQAKYPDLLEKWKETYKKNKARSDMWVPDLVTKDKYNDRDPEISQYLAKLTQMGY